MRDEDVTRNTRSAARIQRHQLMDALRRAQMEGELDAQTDLRVSPIFFEKHAGREIRIAAKAGKDSASPKTNPLKLSSVVFAGAEISVR